jgi:predicted nucleotidyltransferase
MLTADKVRAALEALSPTQEKVDLAVKTAVEIAQPSRVILFGSWARGEAKWDSDLDLAVLIPDSRKSEIGDLRNRLLRALGSIPMSTDLVVASEGYAGEFQASVNSVYYKILRNGKAVYDSGHR